jgi:hypothetical protein
MDIRKKISIGIIIFLIIINFIYVPMNYRHYLFKNTSKIELDKVITFDFINNIGVNQDMTQQTNSEAYTYQKEYNYKLVALIDLITIFISVLLLKVIFKPKNEKVV